MNIENISSGNLNNASHLRFGKDVQARCDASMPKDDASIVKMSDEFAACVEREDASIKFMHGSSLSQEKADIDQRRKGVVVAMGESLRSSVRHPEADIASAAERVLAVLKGFNSPKPITKLSYDAETTAVGKLLDELNANYADDINTTGIKVWTDELAALNAEFIKITGEVAEQKAAGPGYTHQSARRATDVAWRNLCTVVNAALLTGGEEKYKTFVNELNAVVKHYADQLALHRGRAKAGSKEQPAESGEMETGNGNNTEG